MLLILSMEIQSQQMLVRSISSVKKGNKAESPISLLTLLISVLAAFTFGFLFGNLRIRGFLFRKTHFFKTKFSDRGIELKTLFYKITKQPSPQNRKPKDEPSLKYVNNKLRVTPKEDPLDPPLSMSELEKTIEIQRHPKSDQNAPPIDSFLVHPKIEVSVPKTHSEISVQEEFTGATISLPSEEDEDLTEQIDKKFGS